MTMNDFGRTLVLDHTLLASELARAESLRHESRNAIDARGSLPGLSIITPSFHGAEHIHRLLESVAAQTLSPERFELIVVTNGEDDGTAEILRDFTATHPEINVTWVHNSVAGAGAARNLALTLARRDHVTFVDDDDEIQPRFLEVISEALNQNQDRIVVSPIVNVSADGNTDEENNLNVRIRSLRGKTTELHTIPWLAGFNACKTLKRSLATRHSYRIDLPSGEDLVYFSQLLEHPTMQVVIPEDADSSAYVRHLRPDSVSRKTMTYDFNVVERLACIRALQDVEVEGASAHARDQLVRAQAGFVARYLKERPEDTDRVASDLAVHGISQFPWDLVNRGQARDLVISYCFSPFSDTSAVVAAKAIAERGRIVDVITNDLSKIRRYDPDVSALADRWIDERLIMNAPPSFADWEHISRFARHALEAAERNHALKGGYRTMYSRALWIGSHVAAAMFKSRHWDVTWTAEFSDPLRFDANGKARAGTYAPNEISERLVRAMAARGFDQVPTESSFDLVEAATLVLADELIFTNENQLEYMLSKYDDVRLRELARSKATVRHHPVPPAAMYHVVKSRYQLPPTPVNIGYFGSFYPNRGLDVVLLAIENLPLEERRNVRLHVFCNKPAELKEHVTNRGIGANVFVNPYLSYMEFLNTATRFDILLVNDVVRGTDMDINPFLPSKYSDYLGTGRPIWALVDQGSPLTKLETSFSSPGDDPAVVFEDLRNIIRQQPKVSHG